MFVRFKKVMAACLVCPLTLLAAACAPPMVAISTDQPGATVAVDGQRIGETGPNSPISYSFDFHQKDQYTVTATKVGCFDAAPAMLNSSSDAVKAGRLELSLPVDLAYTQTVPNEASDWLRIPISPQYTADSMWQRLIDSVTGVYSNLELMDVSSGYVRSAAVSRTFPHPSRGEFTIRTQFLGSVSSRSPLTYKVKIVSECSYSDRPGEWLPYNRIFTQDAELIEELQSRLGTH